MNIFIIIMLYSLPSLVGDHALLLLTAAKSISFPPMLSSFRQLKSTLWYLYVLTHNAWFSLILSHMAIKEEEVHRKDFYPTQRKRGF